MRLIAFFALLAVPGIADAACPGRFGHLTKYAGEPPSLFLKDPAVSSRIANLMGTQLRHLKTNLSVAPPAALIDCELIVEGNAPHRGGVQNAILSFNLYYGGLTVAILDGDRILVRSTSRAQGNYSHLPAPVRDWIYVAANGFRSRGSPPPNVVLPPNLKH